MTTLYTLSNRFFKKYKVLSDGRVVLMTKNAYSFAVKLMNCFLNLSKSVSDE